MITEVDTAAQNGHAPVTRLCALDLLFSATGTVDVKVGNKTISVPIQSADVEEVQALAGKPPRAPMFQERRDGVMTRVRDIADVTYQEQLERYNRDQMLIWICLGLAWDVYTKDGTLVWSADNKTHNLEGVKQAFKEMGLVDNQLLAIFTAIRALTDSTQEVRATD